MYFIKNLLARQSVVFACNATRLRHLNSKRKTCAILNILYRSNHDDSHGPNNEFDWQENNDEENNEYLNLRDECMGRSSVAHRVFVIQPYIKWGRNKKRNTNPQLQLAEAVALVNTLSDWKVVSERCVPLLTLQRPLMFGSGSLESLKQEAAQRRATAIFISTNVLKFVQLVQLQEQFKIPVFDRYSVIIHIFREHAQSPEAKLQVALAELPYIHKKMNELSLHDSGRVKLSEKQKAVLETRAKKLQKAHEKLKQQRKLIKSRRVDYGFPTVAVVGYTNAGKTSLIKTLTEKSSLEPKDQLFATLDTTVHKGVLPSKVEVLYVDTIGFIQDVPETLMKPFLVTLEDAITADIIVHIFDISHPDVQAQIDHVHETIQKLVETGKTIINVANKCDIASETCEDFLPEDYLKVSASKSIGITELKARIETEILAATGRKRVRVRVKCGSAEEAWFYKETTIERTEPDPKNMDYLLLQVITTDIVLAKFKAFLQRQNARKCN